MPLFNTGNSDSHAVNGSIFQPDNTHKEHYYEGFAVSDSDVGLPFL